MRWPQWRRRPGLLEAAVFFIAAAIAIRAIGLLLPLPLAADRCRMELEIFVGSVPDGLAEVLVPGERIWSTRNGATLGRIREVRRRPAGGSGRSWSASNDLLLRVAGSGRFKRDLGLFVQRNQAVRVGESYPLRTALGSFWGRIERIILRGEH